MHWQIPQHSPGAQGNKIVHDVYRIQNKSGVGAGGGGWWKSKKLIRVRFNDSWFVFQESSWSFHEPYFSRKHVFHES